MKEMLNLEKFIAFCRGENRVTLSRRDRENVGVGRKLLERLQKSGEVYGANTEVGALFKEKVSLVDSGQVQKELVRSHAAGVGEYINIEEARGTMLLLINMLRKGYSGISLPTLEFLVELFNRGIVPAIPIKGSLGASGDLVPLAHLASVLVGEGKVLVGDITIPTKEVFKSNNIKPIKLQSGEGLALINGTHFMTSLFGLIVRRADTLGKTADIIGALTLIALQANPEAFSEIVHRLRPHPGQISSASNIRNLLEYANNSDRPNLQDAYSLRCISQVHGPVKETIKSAKEVVEREINSLSGNPLFVDGAVLHGGNFHGHPLALRADFLSIALTSLSGISERRIERLLNEAFSNGLPAFLRDKSSSGDCGMMIPQYTAASLVSENKTFSHPASVDSIPTAAGQEDFVSMGALAVRKAKEVCSNTEKILAIELLCALRGLEFRDTFSEDCPRILSDMRSLIRKHASYRELNEDIERISGLIEDGSIIKEAEKSIAYLK